MMPGQFEFILNHLWQSTVFAFAAGILTLLFRRNQAQVRYSIWMVASLKFLVPFSVFVTIGSYFPSQSEVSVPLGGALVLERVSQPFVAALPLSVNSDTQPLASDWITPLVWTAWAIGFTFVCFSWWVRSRHVRAALRNATDLDLPIGVRVVSSPSLFEPGVFGIFRPVLLLPDKITSHLSPAELQAVLAHELCHIRRGDNLWAVAHMAVEALFWFHPLVWYVGARLTEERERACDEEVLAKGNTPQAYAEGILKVCELYLESPAPFVAGVTGSDLKQRIRTIMANRRAKNIGIGKKVLLTAAGVAGIAVPIAVGMMDAPPIQAQSASMQSKSAAPKFEVASIRRCPPGTSPSLMSANGGGTPGRIRLVCQSVGSLIRSSYVFHANGRRNLTTRLVPIQKLPGWVDSELYTIEAVAEGTPSPELMLGPMMQALLADRFKLKLHNEYEDMPVYDMTVASGGHKLQPSREGSCRSTSSYEPLTPRVKGQAPPTWCGFPQTLSDGWRLMGATMADLAAALSLGNDRQVVDKTGIAGTFDVHVPLSADLRGLLGLTAPAPLSGAGDPAPRAASQPDLQGLNQTIAQKLGLRLTRAKGQGLILVVDHVERPSEN